MNTTPISINTAAHPQALPEEKSVTTFSAPAFYTNGISMTSREIAELVGSRHGHVKTSIERLIAKEVIQQAALRQVKNHLGQLVNEYIFEGEQGKRDSIVVVAQLCPEFTAKLVDRWQELENQLTTAALPDFTNPVAAARAWADQFEKASHVAIANQHLVQALSMVEKKHETFKDGRGCGETFATINEVTKATGTRHGFWALKKWCDERGAERKEVPLTNETFTYAYPGKAWMDVHGLELTKIFG